jgi:hypothetical protein
MWEEKAQLLEDFGARAPHLLAFVETGSAQGQMASRMTSTFPTVVSIESEQANYEAAAMRTLHQQEVKIIHGDSALLLGPVLANLNRPCLVWLDAHDDLEGIIGRTPLRDELAVLRAEPRRHVVAIDDVRLMDYKMAWPGSDEVRQMMTEGGWCVSIEVEDVMVCWGREI